MHYYKFFILFLFFVFSSCSTTNVYNNKIAILLGTELTGLSDEALELADKRMKIDMYGFTESLNISVSAAICCQNLSNRMRRKDDSWKITEEEKVDIILNWLRNTIKSSSEIEQDFIRKRDNF